MRNDKGREGGKYVNLRGRICKRHCSVLRGECR